MVRKNMNKKFITLIGVIGSIASIVGILLSFMQTNNNHLNNITGNKNIQIIGEGNSIHYNYKEKATHFSNSSFKKRLPDNILELIKLGQSIEFIKSLLGTPIKSYNNILEFDTKDLYLRIGYFSDYNQQNTKIHTIEIIPTNIKTATRFTFERVYQGKLTISKSIVKDILGWNINTKIDASEGGMSTMCTQYWRIIQDRNIHNFTVAIGGWGICPPYQAPPDNKNSIPFNLKKKVAMLAGGFFEALGDNSDFTDDEKWQLIKDRIPEYIIISSLMTDELEKWIKSIEYEYK